MGLASSLVNYNVLYKAIRNQYDLLVNSVRIIYNVKITNIITKLIVIHSPTKYNPTPVIVISMILSTFN